MKKYIIVMLLMIFTLSGCQKKADPQVVDLATTINNQQAPIISLSTLSVFQTNDMYTVVIRENGESKKTVEFSSDRECLSVQGVVLVKNEELNQHLGKKLNELENHFGEIHADVGSGFYIPSYITEDGYLISFIVEDDIAVAIYKRDLLTGEITESLPQ